jgi:hypothetical protein
MKSQQYARDVQAHLLNGGPAPIHISQSALYLSLHSGDPGSNNSQEYLEIPGIDRVQINRTSIAWIMEGETFVNRYLISTKPAAEYQGSRTATHWSLGISPTGQGQMKISGKLISPQQIVAGMILDFNPGSIKMDEF